MNEAKPWPGGRPEDLCLTDVDGDVVELTAGMTYAREPVVTVNMLNGASGWAGRIPEARRLFSAGLAMCDAAEGVEGSCEHCEGLIGDSAILSFILTALSVPDGADPVEWARALAEAVDFVDHCRPGHEVEAVGAIENLRTSFDNLRPAPRALPTEADQWWGSFDDGPMRAVDVDFVAAPDRTQTLQGRILPSGRVSVTSDRWTWLTGPDGLAVRCTPPGGE